MLIALLYFLLFFKPVRSDSNFFSFLGRYDKRKPPLDESHKTVDVKICFVILDIQDVDEFDTKLEMSILVIRSWKEVRLNITSPFPKRKPIVVRERDVGGFWIPDFYIDGSRRSRKGFHEVFSNVVVHEDKTVTHLMRIDIAVRCNFDFYLYPLDVQYCKIDMGSLINSDEIHLSWTSSVKPPVRFYTTTDPYEKLMNLPEYAVYFHVCLDSLDHSVFLDYTRVSFVRFYLILRRRIKSHLMETYVPTGLFVIMSWGSFIVKPDAIPGRMVLLVTNLLSLVTLFESARDSSPHAIGVKCLDVWVLTCIMFVFLALLEYAVILAKVRGRCWKTAPTNKVKSFEASVKLNLGYYQKTSNSSKRLNHLWQKFRLLCYTFCCRSFDSSWDPLDKISLILFPVLFLVFNAFYWSFYLHMRKESLYGEDCEK